MVVGAADLLCSGSDLPVGATDATPPLPLQLQFSRRAASTEDLTKSFGWDSSGSHMQEDVHEFNKILCGRRCPAPVLRAPPPVHLSPTAGRGTGRPQPAPLLPLPRR